MEQSTEFVKDKWDTLTAFSKKEELKEQLWNEVVYRYNAPHRYHHNLSYVAFLFGLLEHYINVVQSPAVIGFAIIYHNIVYDTYRNDNAEESASIAEVHLNQLKVSAPLIRQVQELIIATKDHSIPPHTSQKDAVELFLDFDFAILAASPLVYKAYLENIRKEYSKYNDETYKQGRKPALQKLVDSMHIFKTDTFQKDMEFIARQNIHSELSLL